MRRALLPASLALAIVIGVFANAQDSSMQTGQAGTAPSQGNQWHGQRGDANGRLQRLSQALDLTDDQKTKLKPILESEWQEMKPIRQDASLTKDQKRAKMKEIHEKYQEQISGVLTPEQQEKLKKVQSDRMQRHGTMKDKPAAPPS